MIVFGITGSIACGKSTVTKYIREAGIPVIDADIIAREVVEVGSPALDMIYEVFGQEYMNDDQTLNRAKLGALVFNNPQKLDLLNVIMKPVIEDRLKQRISELSQKHSVIGYDASLLIEEGKANLYRPLIVVSCPTEIQLQRLMKRNSLTEAEARARINCQLLSADKIKFADFVIDTSKELEYCKQQTLSIIEKLKSLILMFWI